MAKEPKQSLRKKLIEIAVCAVIFNLALGILVTLFHPTFKIIVWCAAKIVALFPNIGGAPIIALIVGCAIFFLQGLIVYKGSDALSGIPLIKSVKKVKDAANIVTTGQPVDVICGPVSIHGFAREGYESSKDEFVDVYLPHSPTVLTGQAIKFKKEFVRRSKMSRMEFVLYFVSGGMISDDK
ncbi:MAG: hypothetical protein Q7S36_00260 [Candidatus Liptonbacteria bacterium]|nr:hypothetical protein [Candidatus Liptonbacteria bacterium]